MRKSFTAAGLMLGLACGPAQAADAPKPVTSETVKLAYGAPISLALAERIAAAALAEARRLGVRAAIVIVEPSGSLVWFQRLDGTQYGAIELAQRKAVTSALYRRPTSAYVQNLAAGQLGILTFDLVASPGGEPIVRDGAVVGAIGVSGGAGPEDSLITAAGLAILR